jgi:hypothetical protein
MVKVEGLIKLKTFKALTKTRTTDLPARSIAPQPSTLPHALKQTVIRMQYNFGTLLFLPAVIAHNYIYTWQSVRKHTLHHKYTPPNNTSCMQK